MAKLSQLRELSEPLPLTIGNPNGAHVIIVFKVRIAAWTGEAVDRIMSLKDAASAGDVSQAQDLANYIVPALTGWDLETEASTPDAPEFVPLTGETLYKEIPLDKLIEFSTLLMERVVPKTSTSKDPTHGTSTGSFELGD